MISSALLNALAALLAARTATAQGFGKEQTETHPKLSWKRCSGTSGTDCTSVAGELTLDANYRWIHEKAGYSNCFEDNAWVNRVCTNNKDCTAKCVLDGADYKRTYGVSSANSSVTMNFKTYLDYASNVGSKVYLMQDGDNYEMFKLVGNEFSFEVDVSKLPCGVSGSLYFVSMPQKGFGSAGARYGTGRS
jgi:cellulose 1,4-beta-cellobiosidase